MIFGFNQLFSNSDKQKINFWAGILLAWFLPKRNFNMFDQKFTLEYEHEKNGQTFLIQAATKKGTGFTLNICKTVMERC